MAHVSPTVERHMARADQMVANYGAQIRALQIQQNKWRDLSKACIAMYDLAAGHDYFDHAPADMDAALEALGLPALEKVA